MLTRRTTLLAGTGVLAAPALPRAQAAVTLDVLFANPSFARFFNPIAEAFQRANPDVRIAFRQPAPNYDEQHQALLRGALTNQLPDVTFPGFNRLPELARTLAQRNQILDLGPLIAEEGAAWKAENFADRMLALGQVDGKQYGMPFNASSPIAYYNPELVARGGGNPDAFPTSWEAVVALGGRIKAAVPQAMGVSYYINSFDSDWLWQALVQQGGGRMLNAAGNAPAFGDAAGQAAIALARRFVTDAGMGLIGADQNRQQFATGGTGIIFDSPARLSVITGLVGGRFPLRTAPFPITDQARGGVPTGGNAAVITTRDPAKRAAAWRYVKFSAGPEAQKIAVEMTGYLPTNRRATAEEFLGAWYRENPNARSAAMQADKSLPWEDYGANGPRIHRMQQEVLTAVMRGDIAPPAGLERMVAQTAALMRG
ncbi:extracellular solute-binding protein [Roseomonas alkaliterrae]|uniref:Multiple sugar transport system substrate-binding protein n=1 Tax=Neoroseomonas alkaliterrae TaxID=1452450 RepID=A0A840XN33_9PROT|nr:extracellular solute-binding protein [Neoroseomonas alkaliterrae]MBB5689316.1 multiple sugar transport system substrate-binding protein [Neoroseomonas alkaliterrae]MBR0675863.1 extracellular solute-binding protein [Neoroseomonas alkaliterrae]